MRPNKGSKLLRKGRKSILNQPYLLTATTIERENIFFNADAVRIVLSSLQWLENQGLIELETAVVMPDHIHFIATLRANNLAKLMHSFKSYTANKINLALNRNGPIWQQHYHDHAIRREEDLKAAIEYLLHNPVRAGLVDNFHDYPFWYCKWKVSCPEKSRLEAAPTSD